jgi:WD40 repeat protein
MQRKRNIWRVAPYAFILTHLLIGCAVQGNFPGASIIAESIGPAASNVPSDQSAARTPNEERSIITPDSADQIETLQTLGGHGDGVVGMVFLTDGVQLASLSGDRALSLWDVRDGALVETLINPRGRVYNVAFSQNGSLLAIGNNPANTVGLWDVQAGRRIRTLRGNHEFIMRIAFSPDGSLLASGDDGGNIMLWNVESGESVYALRANGAIGSLAFSPDGTILASGNVEGNTDIELWGMQNGQKTHTIKGHTGNVYNLVFTPDGAQLISASGDRTIKFWDVASGQELRTLMGHSNFVYGLAMSPDGTILISSDSGGMIKVWEVANGNTLSTLNSPIQYNFFLVFSPDGSLFASGGMGDAVTLWGIPR